MQYYQCTFSNGTYTQTAGAPDHTSVVSGKEGDKLVVLEQNVNGKRFVQKGEVNLKDLRKGKVCVYRPVKKELMGELT